MPTFLDELAGLCLDADERASYRQDPAGWLASHRCGHLCGEDVAAAVPVLQSRLPRAIGSRVRLDDDVERADHAAAVPATAAAAPGETELDAAVRVLDHVLSGLDRS